MKRALITGITGQDGSYLAELLLDKGYEVHGLKRRTSIPTTDRLPYNFQQTISLHDGDMTDQSSLDRLINKVQPDEVYNLAALSHVQVSFTEPEYTLDVDGLGTLRLLEILRDSKTRFYQASSSELFGKVQQIPQTELTPFYPRSPYACAKLYAYWITVNYRESYNLFACNGILFNHESPRRGEDFVTRKITQGLARIVLKKQDVLLLGNLEAKRDWGHARDYVDAQWRILQQDTAEDYVIATGRQASVRDFVDLVAAELGLNLDWRGSGLRTEGIDSRTGKVLVAVDPKFFRPAEVETLLGDATKAKEKLGWIPETTLEQLAKEMARFDFGLESI